MSNMNSTFRRASDLQQLTWWWAMCQNVSLLVKYILTAVFPFSNQYGWQNTPQLLINQSQVCERKQSALAPQFCSFPALTHHDWFPGLKMKKKKKKKLLLINLIGYLPFAPSLSHGIIYLNCQKPSSFSDTHSCRNLSEFLLCTK